MRVRITTWLLPAALLAIAACGGGDETQADRQDPAAASPAPATSTPQAATPAPAPAPAPTPVAGEPDARFAALPEPYRSANYSIGRRTYQLCSSCHLVKPGMHLVGPNLHGMFDRRVGEAEGFAYSPALQEADFEWTPEKLDAWLQGPNTFLPGNRMSFAGVRRERDRNAVIAYIMLESGWTVPEGEAAPAAMDAAEPDAD